MASPFLDELIKLVGEKDADRIYAGIVSEYSAHVRKHLAAVKADDPTKGDDADFFDAVVQRVEADEGHFIAETVRALEERRRG